MLLSVLGMLVEGARALLGGCFTSWSCVTKCFGGDYVVVLHSRIHCRWVKSETGVAVVQRR